MSNSDSNLARHSLSSSEFMLFAAPSEAERDKCRQRLELVEQRSIEANVNGEIAGIIRCKVEQAKRFFKSDEFGACQYELDAVEKLLSAGR
jgi:hypothetical protein